MYWKCVKEILYSVLTELFLLKYIHEHMTDLVCFIFV